MLYEWICNGKCYKKIYRRNKNCVSGIWKKHFFLNNSKTSNDKSFHLLLFPCSQCSSFFSWTLYIANHSIPITLRNIRFNWLYATLLFIILFLLIVIPPFIGKECHFYCRLGVFWLCAGNDRLDVLPLSGFNVVIRSILRNGSRKHTVDDHCRTIFTRT